MILGLRSTAAALVALAAVGAGCSSSGGASTPTSSPAQSSSTSAASSSAPSTSLSAAPSSSPARTTRWDHVVVTVLENRGSANILGSPDAPYLNELAHSGLNFTAMYAETHPSQPNYLALFSGSIQGVTDDTCPHTFSTPNLGAQLISAGDTFAGYSENLPSTGFRGCYAYPYVRRHVPWVNFSTVPASANRPLSALPTDYSQLPTVSFVIPDLLDDMHDGSVARSDAWVRTHLSGYVSWARTHHSLLIVTWDEDEGNTHNHIATMAVGDGISPGSWTHRANHYTLLAVLEDAFHLSRLGNAKKAGDLPPLG